MAKKPQATAEAGTKPATIDEVLAHNSQLAEQVASLTATVGDLQRAAANAMGYDAALTETLRNQDRKPVQFLVNYSRAAVMSSVQKDKVISDAYAFKVGEIAMLTESEIERLRDAKAVTHVPARDGTKIELVPILEDDPKKFVSQKVYSWRPDFDERGRLTRKRHVEEVPVAQLMKNARAAG